MAVTAYPIGNEGRAIFVATDALAPGVYITKVVQAAENLAADLAADEAEFHAEDPDYDVWKYSVIELDSGFRIEVHDESGHKLGYL